MQSFDLDHNINKLKFLEDIENLTNINKKTIFWGIVTSTFTFIYLTMGMSLITNLIGFIYPAYKSFKSLNSENNLDDKQWLTYWIVFSLFNLIEGITDLLFFWIPFYYQVKLLFLIWLFHDSTKGANIIYNNYLNKFIKKYEEKIDENINKVDEKIDNIKNLIDNIPAINNLIDNENSVEINSDLNDSEKKNV